MTQQSILAESAKLRKDAQETSRLAALRAAPRSGTKRLLVLAELVRIGSRGWTDDELSRVLGISPNTVRPRRVELVEGEWIIDSGKRRDSFYGNPAIVWVATSKAKKLVERRTKWKQS